MFIELQKAFSRIAVKESEIVKFRTCVYSEDTEIFFKCRDGKNVCSETVNERYNTIEYNLLTILFLKLTVVSAKFIRGHFLMCQLEQL